MTTVWFCITPLKTCQPELYIYLQHWWGRAARKRSICRPRNCDVLDLNTYIRWGVSSSIFSPLRRWFPGWGPSSKQPLFQPPNFSTAIVERKREWPAIKKQEKKLEILEGYLSQIWLSENGFYLNFFFDRKSIDFFRHFWGCQWSSPKLLNLTLVS